MIEPIIEFFLCNASSFANSLENCLISVPIISNVPPLAIWQADLVKMSLIGKFSLSESLAVVISKILSGFKSKIKEKIPLSDPMK